jgi:hypothetical protein
MVENLAEIPWTCSDGPGSAPNEIPKGVSFLEREQEREGGRGPWSSWRRERFPASFTSHSLGPTRARHPRTVRRALTDGPRGARTVRHPGADGPLFAPEHLVLLLFPTSRADGPRCPGGQSARSGRTVRPTAVDGLTSLFNFSLIYLEIKICKGIFWDHCSRIMKETCHMMQCTN